MRVFVLRLAILLSCQIGFSTHAFSSPDDDSAAIEFFETSIRPLLTEKCASCHGDKKQEGGLRLSSRRGAITGGDNGPLLVAGNPQVSLLIHAVGYQEDLK